MTQILSHAQRMALLGAALGFGVTAGAQAAGPAHAVERSPDDIARALGQAHSVTLSEAVALRERPQASERPGLHIPQGTPVTAYREIYNRDGHWQFIEVGDARGWVPMNAIRAQPLPR